MRLNVSLSRPKLLIAQAIILRLRHLRLKPKLGFPLGSSHMNVHTWLLAREEVKPKRADTQNSRAHGWILPRSQLLGA